MGSDHQAYVYREPTSPWRQVVFPYDPPTKDDLLATLPKFARWWDPGTRCWWVLDVYEVAAVVVLKSHSYRVFAKDLIRTPPVLDGNAAAFANVFEALLQEVPAELRLTVYRHLSLALHPDRGGSTELMQRLNTAWDKELFRGSYGKVQ